VVLSALRGGFGFLSTLPVAAQDRHWDAFRGAPWVFPLVGLAIGLGPALFLLLPLPTALAPVMTVVVLYTTVGITHLDGLADTLDALAAHQLVTPAERREVMHDHSIGVAAVLGITLALGGLVGAFGALQSLPTMAMIGVVVFAEVLAKTAMAVLACLTAPAHEGLGASISAVAGRSDVWWAALAATPGIVIGLASGVAVTITMILTACLMTWLIRRVSISLVGGISGDTLGASNELVRLGVLSVGVVVWTLS